MYLRQGRWQDRQIVSTAWVSESTASHSEVGSAFGYGYMWWTTRGEAHFWNVPIGEPSYNAAGWHGLAVDHSEPKS